MYFFIVLVCIMQKFDDIPVSATLNHKKICQAALTCLDEIKQLVSNYPVRLHSFTEMLMKTYCLNIELFVSTCVHFSDMAKL